jgi:hypothetical protein
MCSCYFPPIFASYIRYPRKPQGNESYYDLYINHSHDHLGTRVQQVFPECCLLTKGLITELFLFAKYLLTDL